MKISPSRLLNTEACPKFKSSPFSGSAAEEGIQLHEYMEKMVQEPVDTWDDWISLLNISEASKALLYTASSRIQPLASWTPTCYPDASIMESFPADGSLPPGLYPEVSIKIGRNKFGYMDLLISHGEGNYTIIDYKFVRAAGDFELQLAAYACALSNYIKDAKKINALIVAPHLPEDAEPMEWEFTPQSIEQYKAIIKGIEEAAESPNSDGRPGSHCEHCAWNGKCRYQTSTALATTMTPLPPATQRILQPVTLQDRAERRDLIKCLESMVEAIKEDDKLFFAENPEAVLPGYRATWMPGKTSLDSSRAAEINSAILSTKVGVVTVEDLMSMSMPDTTRLVDHISIAEGISTNDAKRQVNEILDEFMKRGASYVTLRKIGTKKRVPKALTEN